MKGKQRGSPTSCGCNITPAFLRIGTWAKLCNMLVAFPPASRGHTKARKSITPTQGATPKYGSLSPQLSRCCGACGQLGAFGAHRLLRPVPLTANCWPEAPLAGGGGGLGVLGPAESAPPCQPLPPTHTLYPPPSLPPLPPLPSPSLG